MTPRPYFPLMGSKWNSVRHYPRPRCARIVEPFAGSAGYALRYYRSDVVLCERDPLIAGLWRWLIQARPADVLRLPDVQPGQPVADLGLSPAEAALIGFWLGRGLAKPRLTGSRSQWATNPAYARQFWGPFVRRRIADQLDAIRHWTIVEGEYTAVGNIGVSSWFVDPPYCRRVGDRYRYGASRIDFYALGAWCRARPGQVIVCEAEGAKWLPFRPIGRAFTRMSTREQAREAVWTNERQEASCPMTQGVLW